MKNKIYELLRKYVAKRATGNLGKVEILEDQIVCYVDGRKLKKKEKYTDRYNLIFRCIPLKEEIYITYNINKPVHYIIQDVDFDREINIRTSIKNCHVTFENCSFTGAISIDFADHITFINNTYEAQNYKNFWSIYKEGEFCISTTSNKNEINKIEFKNDDINVYYPETIPLFKMIDRSPKKKVKKATLEIWLYAKNLELSNADIINAKSIEIGAENLLIEDSNISAQEIEINADNIILDNTEIKVDTISIETNKIDKQDTDIIHKGLFINGIEVNKNELNITKEKLALQQERLKLLSALKKIEAHAKEQISQELKQQPLTRVLKK